MVQAATARTNSSRTWDNRDGVLIRERHLSCTACHRQRTDVFLFGRWTPGECPECNPAPAAVSPEPAERESIDRAALLRKLEASGINPRKYASATLDGFRLSHDSHAFDRAGEYVDRIRATKGDPYADRPWAYFFGDGASIVEERGSKRVVPGKVGNGKTFLAVAIARALIEDGTLQPSAVRFATAERIILATEATFRSGSETSELRLIGEYAAPELLIVDDFFVRPPSPHVARLFDEILKEREGKATIFTSNVSLPVIHKFDPALLRLTDRLAGNSGESGRYVVKFVGPSVRNLISRGEA